MTGFGRASGVQPNAQIDVEISSVNRKQFACSVSLPGILAPFEERCRALLGEQISRGQLQVCVKLRQEAQGTVSSFDPDAVRARVAELRELARLAEIPFSLSVLDLYQMRDLFSGTEPSKLEETLWPLLRDTLLKALASHQQMREHEGGKLRLDLEKRIAAMRELHAKIAQRAPEVPRAWKKALLSRIAEMQISVPADHEAIAREVALTADRCDISEELTRLNAHFDHALRLFSAPECAGRKLDFLCQEMNRETNTIASKCNDREISACAISLKALIETFREQIQNIE